MFLKQLSISNIPPTTEAKVFIFLCEETTVTVLHTSLSENVYEVCSNPIICAGGEGHTYIHMCSNTLIPANHSGFSGIIPEIQALSRTPG